MRKTFSFFIALTLSVGLWAQETIDNVAYIDANGEPQTADNVTLITDSPTNPVTWGAAGQTTWYVVQEMALTMSAVCYGDVHLILADDAMHVVSSGIQVSGEGNSLTIYGQAAQSGQLVIDVEIVEDVAGIGGGNQGGGSHITINGGKIMVNGGTNAAGIGGGNGGSGSYITINGGEVTATGGTNAAGIGGGNGGSGSYVIINGGTVTATGGKDAAGIGGGYGAVGSNITINGGTVTATGGKDAAGIGGGNHGGGSYITIDGGTVTATGGEYAAGIGGGYGSSGSNIIIRDGKVTANAGNNAAGVGGGGFGGDCSNITINGGEVTANGGQNGGAAIGAGSVGSCSYINITGGKVTATAAAAGGAAGIGVDADAGFSGVTCQGINITGGEVIANGAEGASAIGGGQGASVYNIFAAAALTIRADNNNPPATIIAAARNSDTDIANDLAGKRYAKIEIGQTKTVNYGDYISVSPEFASGTAIKEGIEITFTAADRWNDYYEFIGFYKESTFSTPITEGVSGNVYTVTVMDDDISVYAKYEKFTPVFYVDAGGQEKIAKATEITNSSSTLNAGWYVVTGDNVSTGTLVCSGDVHLILADGAKLTATGNNDSHTPGIQVSGEGNSLDIYGQTAQSGQLIATGGTNAAGIGGGKYGSGSNITINGCKVTANGGDCGAGIGGGQHGSGSNITIKGGTVTATGGKSAAGIGGGDDGSGSNITINGGVVTATGGSEAAGIGGGCGGYGPYIIITGGTVTATGGDSGSGIGCGSPNSSPNIFVAAELTVAADNHNPPTTVIAHTTTTDIASDLNGKRYAYVGTPQGGTVTYGDYITVSPVFTSGDHIAACTQVTFTADDRWADNHEFIGFYKESTFNTPITVGVSGRVYTTTVVNNDISVYAKYEPFTPIPYIDADGQPKSVKATEITNSSSTLSAGWYVVSGNDVRTGMLTCNGAVHLILADGAKLTATGNNDSQTPGIQVSGEGNSLTIYGQTAQSGQLIANGGELFAAGIGSGRDGSASHITINGGTVTANGGQYGAGIGGGISNGHGGAGSYITINGGTVTATGGSEAAGIGGGSKGSGSNITINGGTVTANGGQNAAGMGGAGIGGGSEGSGSNITINGGTVTANGGQNAAGIGGGWQGSGSNIKVATGFTVYVGNTLPPTTEISHTDNDIAPYITALRYVMVKDVATGSKEAAIAAINAAIEGVTNEDIIAIATNAIDAINAATSVDVINAIKEQTLAAIAALKSAYASALGEMGEPCEDCPSVEVTKGTKTVKLYNPESVKFKKE